MAYIISTRYVHEVEADDPDFRVKHAYPHMEYLEEWEEKLITAGGLLSEEGKVIGGCITLAVDSLAEAKQFLANDPLQINGLIGDAKITRWHQTFLHDQADTAPFFALDKKEASSKNAWKN